MRQDSYTLEDRRCTSFSSESASCLLLQLGDGNDLAALKEEVGQIEKSSTVPFDMVFLGIDDWNGELSPWTAPPVFGDEGFGDGADETLTFVENVLVPDSISRFGLNDESPVIIGGYSLSAFFSLWSAYQTDRFSAVSCASPSVWFPGWIDYAKTHCPKVKHIYLSLGDKEEKTRNPVMSKVGSCIKETERIPKSSDVDCFLEWNQGNHFKDTGARCAKGFSWCIGRVKGVIA